MVTLYALPSWSKISRGLANSKVTLSNIWVPCLMSEQVNQPNHPANQPTNLPWFLHILVNVDDARYHKWKFLQDTVSQCCPSKKSAFMAMDLQQIPWYSLKAPSAEHNQWKLTSQCGVRILPSLYTRIPYMELGTNRCPLHSSR